MLAIRESLAAEDLDEYHTVLRVLRGEGDPRSVALAAIRLYHEAAGNTVDENEIPDLSAKLGSRRPHDPPVGGPAQVREARAWRGAGRNGLRLHRPRPQFGVRPGDLVGATANETNLEGRQIGPIRITEMFAVVGVPEGRVDSVVDALRNTMIRGRSASVRRYVDGGGWDRSDKTERPDKKGHRGQGRPTGRR